LARDAEAPLLARLPFDPILQAAADAGDVAGVAEALAPLATALLSRLDVAGKREEPRA